MTQTNLFGEYVKTRLGSWGHHFALHRDCEYLGHQSRNMLQVLIDHRGEMPPRATGYKPLEVDPLALQVEHIVTDLAMIRVNAAIVLRAWYCGRGRVRHERYEIACEMMRSIVGKDLSQRQYYTLHDIGFAHVEGALSAIARA